MHGLYATQRAPGPNNVATATPMAGRRAAVYSCLQMRRFILLACVLTLGCDKSASTPESKDSAAAEKKDSAATEKKAEADEPKSDAVIKFKKLEDSIPVSDTGVKFQINLEGTKGPVVSAATGSLIAVYKDGGAEKSDVLATETDDGAHWSPEDNPFPGSVGGDWEFAGSVFMDDDKNTELQKLYADKANNNLKLMLKVELKSSGGAIAPVEREITLLPPKAG